MKRKMMGRLGLGGLAVLATAALLWSGTGYAQMKGGSKSSNMTSVFSGKKVNAGTVMHEHKDGQHVLTLSDDFQIPDTPDPHWQVVDSSGNTYLLQRLKVGGVLKDKVNKSITVPGYIRDIAKVQIWCGYAEIVLGEAAFSAPIRQ